MALLPPSVTMVLTVTVEGHTAVLAVRADALFLALASRSSLSLRASARAAEALLTCWCLPHARGAGLADWPPVGSAEQSTGNLYASS